MAKDAPKALENAGPDATYRARLAEGRFCLQQCEDCKTFLFPPRWACVACGSAQLAWREASGRGTVYSTSIVRRKPESGGDLNIALVDLAEGPRMMSRVEGMAPTEVRIEMAVKARIADVGGKKILVFDEV